MNISASDIKEAALALGADTVGIAPSEPVENPERFTDWLNNGYAGEMDYMKRNLEKRFNPAELMPGAKSIIVIGINYFSDTEFTGNESNKYKVAMYAHGEDYHNALRRLLKKLLGKIRDEYNSDIEGRICIDTVPFMDIYWAQRAGIGWQGKHTGLVSRQFGNYLLIGSLILNIKIDSYDNPHKNHCGTCRRCLDSCPAGALVKPYIMDASRCISYWTIESKRDTIPENISSSMKGWVFGCDICLSACPFNRFRKSGSTVEFRKSGNINLIETGEILNLTEVEFKSNFKDSPILRPGLSGIKRNIKAVDNCRRD